MASTLDAVPYIVQQPARHIPAGVLGELSPSSSQAIARLLAHRPQIPYNPLTPRTAAVFLGLFEHSISVESKSRIPGLQVLLTTRASTLRTHPSQTALPGGRCDPSDGHDADYTARREAFEEVGLPMELGDEEGLWKITTLEPFMSKYGLIVYPVIYLMTSPIIIKSLQASPLEVSNIFSFPLGSCLTGSYAGNAEDLVEKGGQWWPYDEEDYNFSDTPSLGGGQYRMHRFRTTASPLKGLTSDILITTATIAYDREPAFDRWPANPSPVKELILGAVRDGQSIVGVEDKRSEVTTVDDKKGAVGSDTLAPGELGPQA